MRIRFSFICVAICILGIVSCKKEQFIQPETKIIKETIEEDDLDFLSDVFWIGPDYEDKEVFLDRASLAPDIASAAIVVLPGTALEANIDIVDQAFRDSKVIILCDPDFSVYNVIADTLGWPISGYDEKSELFAFSLVGTHNLRTPEDPIVIDNPEILPDSDSDLTIPDVIPNEEGIIEEYEEVDFDELIKLKYIIEPFVERVNAMFVDLDCSTKAGNTDKNSDYEYGGDTFTIPVELLFAETTSSKKDYVKGNYQCSVRWKYLPLYSFGNKSTSGDYYIMNLSYESHSGEAFEGEDVIRSHGAVDVHYTGAFLRSLDVKTYIKASETVKPEQLPRFIEGHTPLPETTLECKNYSQTRGWNIGGGVSRGVEASDDPKVKYESNFSWGYSNSSTVSFNLSDMKVEDYHTNTGDGAMARWKMVTQNLPKKKGVRNITSCPSIAKTTSSLHTNWIWNVQRFGDGSTKSVGDMIIEVNPVLGIARNGFWFKYADYSYPLSGQSLKVRLKAPNRTPFATIRFNNTIENVVIKDLVVKDVNKKRNNIVFESSGDLLPGKALDINLALGKYSMTFKGTNSKTRVINTYVLGDNSYEVKKARTADDDIVDLDVNSRFKVKN